MNSILNEIENASYAQVRKFVVDYMQLDVAEIYLFTAFKAPKEEIFYLSENSETWRKLKECITEVKIINGDKYLWKLRFVLNSVCASGAAVFRGLEEDNIFA